MCSVIPSLILASLTPEYIRIHHVSTITMGNFDLSPFIASSHSVSFGAAASIGQRSWSASSGYGGMAEGMGGVDLETVKYGGYYRDRIGLGGDEGVVWNGRGGCVEGEPGWDGGREGGLFLEECRAKNCFFGCGLSHPDTRYVGGGDMYGRDWGYHYAGGGGGYDGDREHSFGTPYRLDTNRLGTYNGYIFSTIC